MAEVVQCLIGHTAGHGAVADDGDDVPVGLAGRLHRLGQTVGVAEDRGRVAVFDPVVLTLASVRIARKTARLAKLREPGRAAGDNLVDVGLVAGVPQQDVPRRVEHPVQGEGQFDHTQVGTQVSGVHAHGAHNEFAHLHRQAFKLGIGETSEIVG